MQSLFGFIFCEAVQEILHLLVDEAGAARNDVPGTGQEGVRVGADAAHVELGQPVLGGNVAALCGGQHPAKSGLEVALAAAAVDQPLAKIELGGVIVLAGGPGQEQQCLRVVLFLAAYAIGINLRQRILRVGNAGSGSALVIRHGAGKTCVAGMQSEGTTVHWLRSFFLPGSSQTHCYFEGPSLDAVTELNRRAGLPFEQIVEVAEMTPGSV